MPGQLWNLESLTLMVEDGAGHSVVLTDVQGDPSLGDEMPEMRSVENVMIRHRQVGAMKGPEQAQSLSFQAVHSTATQRAINLCCASGSEFGSTGTTPAVSTDTVGNAMAVKITVSCSPANGSGWKKTWARAYPKFSVKSAVAGATVDLSFDCWERADS